MLLAVSAGCGNEIATAYSALFHEVSAQSGKGVEEAFKALALEMLSASNRENLQDIIERPKSLSFRFLPMYDR